jgi:hypothetical protein
MELIVHLAIEVFAQKEGPEAKQYVHLGSLASTKTLAVFDGLLVEAVVPTNKLEASFLSTINETHMMMHFITISGGRGRNPER